MEDEQTQVDAQRLREWSERWNGLKWLLLAFKKLMLWTAAVGAGLIVLWDMFHRLIAGGAQK